MTRYALIDHIGADLYRFRFNPTMAPPVPTCRNRIARWGERRSRDGLWGRETDGSVPAIVAWLDARGIEHRRIGFQGFHYAFDLDRDQEVEFRLRWG